MKKAFERLILAAGFLTIGWLLWHFEPRKVWEMVSQVGLVGFLAILAFQILDHAVNAVGWRFAFSADEAGKVPLWTLIKARVAGDGVNYLTPSGQIAGELIRPGMLGDAVSDEVKNTSVLVAKLSQAMGQAIFIVAGIVFVVTGKLDFLQGGQRLAGIGASTLIFLGVAATMWLLAADIELPKFFLRWPALAAMRAQMRGYLKRHPVRFMLSVVFFILGYAWGALEVLLICRFMGLDMPASTALAVEILSNAIDSVMFMVPAKMGTQEGGKTAIFHGLGYPAGAGLAFGLIRHVREILWASAGLWLYAVSRRSKGLPASLPKPPAPASRAG
jgi:hypothetical protein